MTMLSRLVALAVLLASLPRAVSSYAVTSPKLVASRTARSRKFHWISRRHQSAVPSESFGSTVAAGSEARDYSDCVSWNWDRVASSAFDQDKRPIILFDGQCSLCSASVNYCLDHDPEGHFRFVSLESKVGQSLLIRSGRHPRDTSSIMMCTEDGKAFAESDAVCKIAQGLGGQWLPAAGWLGERLPRFVRDPIYKVISDNRFRFGGAEADQCRMDFDGTYTSRFVDDPDA